jgi:uncharacterized protein YgiM (DUF1202 family)
MRAVFIVLAVLLISPAAHSAHHASKKIGVVLSCGAGATFRSAPRVIGKVLARIDVGTLLPVFKIFERNWLQVSYKGQKGWVHRTMVIYSAQLDLNKTTSRPASCRGPIPQET